MITIYDDATLEAALATQLDGTRRDLIERITSDARASDLWDALTGIVLIDDNDTAEDFEEALGFPPSSGPLGIEGDDYWSWLERHGDRVEMMMTAGDSGFAWFIIMPTGWFDERIGRR